MIGCPHSGSHSPWKRPVWLGHMVPVSLYPLLLSHLISRPHGITGTGSNGPHKWPEHLMPASPKTPKEVHKLFAKYKKPIEVARELLSAMANTHAKALVLRPQVSGLVRRLPRPLRGWRLSPTPVRSLGCSGERRGNSSQQGLSLEIFPVTICEVKTAMDNR